MKWKLTCLLAYLLLPFQAPAQPAPLTLASYLEDVRTHNPEARSTLQSIASYESRVREAEVPITPQAYANLGVLDDKKPTLVPLFMGTETRQARGRIGLRDQTSFGTTADLYVNGQRTQMQGLDPSFASISSYFETTAALSITQSLWQNGFGEATRAQVEANKAANEMNLLQARFKMKNIMLNAQNIYWSLVSYNEIVKLQESNVERARRLRDYMNARTKLKLFEDTDAMQAEASFQSRELELQSSLDDRAVMARQMNTLRGRDADNLPDLETLPASDMMNEVEKNSGGHMSREDFDLLRAQAKAGLAQARAAKSQIQPQLDLNASIATNGKDGIAQFSVEQAQTSQYPTWSFGLTFSVPLDLGLISDLKRGYRNAGVAAEELKGQAEFTEERTWSDLLKQKHEAQGRYERSLSVEKIQTELVARERRRLMAGRATTFESLSFEQNLALAQIQRVRSQLALLQIHNTLKTFEAKQ